MEDEETRELPPKRRPSGSREKREQRLRGRKQKGELGRRDVDFSAPKENGGRKEKGLG